LIVGTGKYASFEVMAAAVAASGAEMVTVAVRLVDFERREADLTSFLAEQLLLLPNTAGARTAAEAVRVAQLARAGGLPDWVKLEVIPDPRNLLPDPVGTLEAAEVLVGEGFTVLPYMFPDPQLARRLEELGCATLMPLAAPIGSGRGLKLTESIKIIIEEAGVPVVVDAGLGAPSEAAAAMELGADAVLVNTAIALAHDPVEMADAFRLAVEAGRRAYRAGLMQERTEVQPSSPVAGVIGSR
jgi:thiazole synthase